MRRLFKVLILMGILFPLQVFALGLGELQTQSALNQPFKAELQLLRVSPSELKGLKVKLASEEDYSRIGLERLPILNTLSFKIVQKGSAHYIRITSTRRISEPYLNFLVEVNWSRGRLLREFTVLLDPPELLGSGAPDLTTPETQAPKGDAPAAQTEEPEELISRPDDSAVSDVQASSVSTAEASIVYGPVERNEQLWNIAEKIRGNRDATVPQIMMALLRNNPEAFTRENVNNLKRGYVLRIENPQDIYEMDVQEASVAFKRQYQLWQDYKQSLAESASAKAEASRQASEQKAAQTSETVSPETTDGVLTLERPQSKEPVAGHLESSQPGSGKQNEQIGRLRDELAAAEQSAELSYKRNEEMHERLKAMEDQIASLQRLMQIKSDELVALQETQKESPVAATAPLNEQDTSSIQQQFRSVLSELQKNPQLMGLVGGTILLLLTMFWVIARKRRAAGESDYRFNSEHTNSTFIDRDADYGVSAPRTIEEDPLTQADIFVAYGNLDAAVNLMSSAVEKNPENSEYHQKLDDLASMLAKRDGKIEPPVSATDVVIPEEEELHDSLLTSEDLAAFQHEFENTEKQDVPVIDLSEARLSLVDDADRFEALLTVDEAEQISEPTAESIEFDLGDLDDELEQLTLNAEAESSSDGSVLEFDLDELNDVSELPDVDATLDDIESSIDISLDHALDEITLDTELPEVDDDGLIEIGDHEPDLLNSVDEVGTKLDLARAYIDMGDPEGARSILDEVLLEGNENQVAQAHELLDQI